MKKRKVWMFSEPKKAKVILPEAEKNDISEKCQPLVDIFKKKYLSDEYNKTHNYPIDIYTYWYRNFFYFIEKFKSESPDRIADEFEHKFVRLEYRGQDNFNFSYFRYTGQWHLVVTDVTLEKCLEMMQENPNFKPIR